MRKMLANPILSLTMMLSALNFPILVQDQTNIVAAQDAASTAPPELMKPAEARVLALNQMGVDKALSVMTDKGADQYMGMMLMQFAQLGQMGGIGEPSEELEQFQETVAKYRLDQVQIDMAMPNSSGSGKDC